MNQTLISNLQVLSDLGGFWNSSNPRIWAKLIGRNSMLETFPESETRPPKLDRWVNIFINLDPVSWPPILVHKIGEKYYVEDGHHRVSVAQSIGMLFIQAKIWEYPVQQKRVVNCEPAQCQKRSLGEAYVMG